MVVVGDDQQISPYGIGIADSAIADLQHHYLDGIPHHNVLSAQSSVYANAKIRFGQNIVLREHFRCMPEIIQFSNDLATRVMGRRLIRYGLIQLIASNHSFSVTFRVDTAPGGVRTR